MPLRGRVVARTHTGRKLDAPYAHVFSFRDGKGQPQRQLPRHGTVGSRTVLSLPQGNYILVGDGRFCSESSVSKSEVNRPGPQATHPHLADMQVIVRLQDGGTLRLDHLHDQAL